MHLLDEFRRVQDMALLSHPLVKVNTLGEVEFKGKSFPILGVTIGVNDNRKPALGLFGGVHGLEKIGSEAVLAYLESICQQLLWDEDLNEQFQDLRIVSIPVINPVGIYNGWRSNGRGVDLMRNAPVEAIDRPPFLMGGQRFSSYLPYFRGNKDEMEKESQVLIDFVKKEMFEAEAALAIDFHSGFGLVDRLWYPYAKTTDPFPKLQQALALKGLLERTYPHHVYHIEPQSLSYTTHGDLWDYLFDHHEKSHPTSLFIPWTLEMGSWRWLKKNPRQLFKTRGIFDPIQPHRRKRIMRRHILLVNFFLRAVRNYRVWA